MRFRLGRELTLAVTFVLFVGVLALGIPRLRMLGATASAKPAASSPSRVVPWIGTDPTPQPSMTVVALGTVTPEQAALVLRDTVTDLHPVLVPSALPPNTQARVSAQKGSFTVEYEAPGFSVAIIVAKLDFGLNTVHRTFRGVPALYEVSDPAHPDYGQFLFWTEPGASPLDPKGVPYFLKVGGLSADQFWKVANSIGPLPPQTVRFCEASDLHAAFGGQMGATGHMIATIAINNHSSTPCVLDGYPQLQLLLANGSPIPVPQTNSSPLGSGEDHVLPVVLAAGQADSQAGFPQTAGVTLEWVHCPEPHPAIANIRMVLPGGRGSVTMPATTGDITLGSSRCNDLPDQEHSLRVSPFTLVLRTADSPTPPEAITAKLDMPQSAHTGQPLRYTVTLTNVSGAPFVLDPCPSYVEILGAKDAMATYQLNCKAAGPIAPGGSLTFEMVLNLAANVPTGEQLLSWTLDPPFLTFAQASVTVVP